ncbi:hypothetical protein DIPPA_18241 [Diplonema papillatum]|nr:hypothetical protein DIPPA_18241 [Diplonema papillatum]
MNSQAQWMASPPMYQGPPADMAMPGGNMSMFLPVYGRGMQAHQHQGNHGQMQYYMQQAPDMQEQVQQHMQSPMMPSGQSAGSGGAVSIHQVGDHTVLRGPEGVTVPIPMRIRVKDPAVRGNVLYDIPSQKIEPTMGMWEYLEGQHKGGSHRAQCHRATLCKLFLEDRCGQGTKCKSFHIDRHMIEAMRMENNVEFDQSFLTEVAVVTPDGCVSAVRYKNIIRSKGLDVYKANLPGRQCVPPARVCSHFAATMACPDERNCDFIHIKPTDLKDSIRRTPCCFNHGDASTESALNVSEVVDVKGKASGGTWRLCMRHVALTNGGAKRLGSGALGIHDICAMHVKSRCKFGRGCDRVHICRHWATEVGLSAQLNTRMAATAVGRTFLHTNPQNMGQGASSLSPGSTSCGTARSHPPSPSGYSLYSVSSEAELSPLTAKIMNGVGIRHCPSAAGMSSSGFISSQMSAMNTSFLTTSTPSSPEPDDENPPLTTSSSATSMKRLGAFPAVHNSSPADSDDDEPGFDLLDDPTESLLNLISEN